MSTILKALRRLEEEKNSQEKPALRESVVAVSPPVSRKRPIFFLIALALVVLVAGVSWWQLRRVEFQEPVVADVAAPAAAVREPKARSTVIPSPPVPAPPRIVSGEPSPRAPQERIPPAPKPEPVAVVETSPAPAPNTVSPSAPAVVETPPVPAPEPVSPPAPAVAKRPAPAPSTSVPEEPIWSKEVAVVKPRSASEPRPAETTRTITAPAPRPAPREQPSFQRVPMPEVVVTRTLWHPLSERRSAVVQVEGETDVRQMSEGDSVGGLVLLRIEPSGVVFAHDGVQIQRRVGK